MWPNLNGSIKMTVIEGAVAAGGYVRARDAVAGRACIRSMSDLVRLNALQIEAVSDFSVLVLGSNQV